MEENTWLWHKFVCKRAKELEWERSEHVEKSFWLFSPRIKLVPALCCWIPLQRCPWCWIGWRVLRLSLSPSLPYIFSPSLSLKLLCALIVFSVSPYQLQRCFIVMKHSLLPQQCQHVNWNDSSETPKKAKQTVNTQNEMWKVVNKITTRRKNSVLQFLFLFLFCIGIVSPYHI